MVTIKEIAQACNVSIATVSNILNGKPNVGEETRKRVLKVIQEMDYTPNSIAKNLKMNKSSTIGIIAEDITVFCTPEIIDGISECCEKNGYQVLLTNMRMYKKYSDTYYNRKDFSDIVNNEIRELLSKRVEGIIYITAHERSLSCFPDDLKVPACVAYGQSMNPKFPSVSADDTAGAYSAITHLVDQGHRTIGVITGKDNTPPTSDRLLGYQRALADAHIRYNPDLVVIGDWGRESGYMHTDTLLERGVTAIFCMNDIIAGGVYDRLSEHGLHPGRDLAVVGFDNQIMSEYYFPPLSTIALPLFEIGYTACQTVINILEQPSQSHILAPNPHNLYLERCRLICRSSVTRIK